MTTEEKREAEMLLHFLRDFHVVRLVCEYYEKYENTAPEALLNAQIEKVRQLTEKKHG